MIQDNIKYAVFLVPITEREKAISSLQSDTIPFIEKGKGCELEITETYESKTNFSKEEKFISMNHFAVTKGFKNASEAMKIQGVHNFKRKYNDSIKVNE